MSATLESSHEVLIHPGRRVVLPVEVLRFLGVRPGDKIKLSQNPMSGMLQITAVERSEDDDRQS